MVGITWIAWSIKLISEINNGNIGVINEIQQQICQHSNEKFNKRVKIYEVTRGF